MGHPLVSGVGGEIIVLGDVAICSEFGETTSMSTSTDVQTQNRELARQINEEALRDPHSPYAGKFVGIANGQVVVVEDSLTEMARRLRQIEPDPRKTSTVEAGLDYNDAIDIWSFG